MKKNSARRWISPILALAWVLLLVGCDTDFTIVIDRSYSDATVQIDFIKIQRGDIRWKNKDPEDYFTPGDSLREEAVIENRIYSVYHNVPDRRFRGRIGPDSTAWEQFGYNGRGEPDFDIFVMVDAPVAAPNANPRTRRKLIPLDRGSWSGSFLSNLNPLGGNKLELNVRITPDGVLLDPAPQGSG